MSIESIFFDFDGTLQGFENHSISESTAEALKLLKQKNYKIFIATGRSLLDLPEVINQFEFDGFINNNGAMCSDADKQSFYIDYIPQTDIQALIDYDKINPFSFSFMSENDFVINRINENVEKSFAYFGMKVPEIIDFDQIDLDKIMQMNIFVDHDFERFLMQNVMKDSIATRWIEYFADVNPKGVSKMNGIERLINHFNLNINKTMAFGDGGNDISMIKGCTKGIAMGNAKDEIKNVADYVTTSADDNGIWNALKFYSII